MEPHLENHDKELFYKYLDRANVYFEFGSGGSTYQASIRDNIKCIYSVESDQEWQNKLLKLNNGKINFIYQEMSTLPNNWGNPGVNATDAQKIGYSDSIHRLSNEEKNTIDLVLIDGRFRVACCLKCFDVINDDCFILFDDFLNRKQYHVVLDYFNVVEQTRNNRMVVLQKKRIPQYQLI